jgi:phenylacetate-CoA ligase
VEAASPSSSTAPSKAVDIARWASARIPLWRSLIRRPVDADTWHELPVIDRATLSIRMDDSLAPGLQRTELASWHQAHPGMPMPNGLQVFLSAGAHGVLGLYVWDQETWAHFLRRTSERISQSICGSAGRVALVGTDDPRHTLTRSQAAWSASQVRVVGLQQGVGAACKAIEGFQPDVLLGISSCLVMLADAQVAGELLISPQCVLGGTDYLSAVGRSTLHRAWGAPVRIAYTTTEGGLVASECSAGYMHVDTTSVYLEQTSHGVLLTNLHNRAQPIIRLKLPDDLVLSHDACECGTRGPLLTIGGGRENLPLRVPGINDEWTLIHPIAWRSALDDLPLSRVPTVALCEGIAVVTTEVGWVERVEKRLSEAWLRAGANPAALHVVVADAPSQISLAPMSTHR